MSERVSHAAAAPGLSQVRRVAAELARRTGVPDNAPDWVDDLLLRRCHELLAALKTLEQHTVCASEPHASWCPKATP